MLLAPFPPLVLVADGQKSTLDLPDTRLPLLILVLAFGFKCLVKSVLLHPQLFLSNTKLAFKIVDPCNLYWIT